MRRRERPIDVEPEVRRLDRELGVEPALDDRVEPAEVVLEHGDVPRSAVVTFSPSCGERRDEALRLETGGRGHRLVEGLPGMNRRTLARTKRYRGRCVRSQRFSAAHSTAFRRSVIARRG